MLRSSACRSGCARSLRCCTQVDRVIRPRGPRHFLRRSANAGLYVLPSVSPVESKSAAGTCAAVIVLVGCADSPTQLPEARTNGAARRLGSLLSGGSGLGCGFAPRVGSWRSSPTSIRRANSSRSRCGRCSC